MPPGRGVALGDEFAGLFVRHEAEVVETVERQMCERIVDHQVIDVLVRMPASWKASGPAVRKAREELNVSIWLTIGVSTLSPVPMM